MRIDNREDAAMLRELLAPMWAEYYAANGQHDTIVSTNMCCRTAAMVTEIDGRWIVVHGTVADQAHAWSQLPDGTVMDLTGDQFGEPPVVWGKLPGDYLASDVATSDCPGCSVRESS